MPKNNNTNNTNIIKTDETATNKNVPYKQQQQK